MDFLTLVVQQSRGHEEVGHGAVVVGFNLRHGGPEQWDVVFNWHLDHGLVDLVVDFRDLNERRASSYQENVLKTLYRLWKKKKINYIYV